MKCKCVLWDFSVDCWSQLLTTTSTLYPRLCFFALISISKWVWESCSEDYTFRLPACVFACSPKLYYAGLSGPIDWSHTLILRGTLWSTLVLDYSMDFAHICWILSLICEDNIRQSREKPISGPGAGSVWRRKISYFVCSIWFYAAHQRQSAEGKLQRLQSTVVH